MVIDDPESKKNKKYYLVLTSGSPKSNEENVNLQGVTMDAEELERATARRAGKKSAESNKLYILRKKDLMKRRGRKVALDSKFTGRKRRARF